MQRLFRLWKSTSKNPYFKSIIIGALLFGIAFLTFWIRIQGVDRLPEGQFTEHDAYLYQWQSKTISEMGHLPPRDMSRWLPNGRDNGQLLSIYSYAIAYIHKTLAWAFPLTHYHIQLYLPVFCFTLGICVLFIFLTRSYGILFASIVCVILATLPGSVERSAAGFGDRDAWCWMVGVLAVTSYLWKEQISPGWRRYLATALAGFTVLLGGLSWEGYGVFVLIILCAELWKFCATDKEQHLTEYLLWLLMFVPWLYLLVPAYRSGYGFSTHVAVPMLAAPIIVLTIRGIRLILLTYVKNIHPYAKKFAWGLTFLAIGAGISYLFFQSETFETTVFALRKSRLMESVRELVIPSTEYWNARYGTIVVLGSIGLICGCNQLWTKNGRLTTALSPLLSVFLSSFIVTTFLRQNVSALIGEVACDRIFLASLVLVAITVSLTSFQKDSFPKRQIFLIMLVWFLLWGALARSGKRYDFFIGLPLAFGTARLLCVSLVSFIERLKDCNILSAHLKTRFAATCAALTVLGVVLFWTPLGGHATRAVPAAAQMRKPIPGKGHIASAIEWAKTSLTPQSVIASNWDYGTQFNVFSNVKTIIDSDHFLPHWIHLYFRHVYCAQSEQEALEFLKTHQATHLMLTESELLSNAWQFSYIGSDKNNDRHFRISHLDFVLRPVGAPYRFMPHPNHNETPFKFIDITRTSDKDFSITTHFCTENTDTNALLTIEQFNDKHTTHVSVDNFPAHVPVDIGNGGIILYFDSAKVIYKANYIAPLGWNSFAVKLFLRREHTKAFVPVYTAEKDGVPPKIKIWEIHYPPNIKTDQKYLVTEPVYSEIGTKHVENLETHYHSLE